MPVAFLAQSVEHETLNLRVVGSSPTESEVLPMEELTSAFLTYRARPLSFGTDALSKEANVLHAVLWKFKNAFRRHLVYRRLVFAQRQLKRVINTPSSAPGLQNLTTAVLEAYRCAASILHEGHQIPLMLTLIAILARIHSVSQYLLKTQSDLQANLQLLADASDEEDLGIPL